MDSGLNEVIDMHPPIHRVQRVFPIYPTYLLLEFDTGEYRIADFRAEVERSGELFEPLKQWAFFRQVQVDEDQISIVWPNGLDVDPGVLYVESKPITIHQLMDS